MDQAPITFHARSVVLEHPSGASYLLGFADDPDSPRHYLMLQRDFEPLEAVEEAPGYYLEWCGPEQAGWGGVDTVTQAADRVTFTFEPAVGAMLGFRCLTITFDAGGVDHATLAARLRRMFRDCGVELSLL